MLNPAQFNVLILVLCFIFGAIAANGFIEYFSFRKITKNSEVENALLEDITLLRSKNDNQNIHIDFLTNSYLELERIKENMLSQLKKRKVIIKDLKKENESLEAKIINLQIENNGIIATRNYYSGVIDSLKIELDRVEKEKEVAEQEIANLTLLRNAA